MDNESLDRLLFKLDTFLNEYETISAPSDKLPFLKSHLQILDDFNDSLILLLQNYQFKEPDNPAQNAKSDILQNIIIRLLGINGFFEHIDYLKYFKSKILEHMSRNEKNFATTLQFKKVYQA